MHKFNNRLAASGEAEVLYSGGDYLVRKPGAFVRCAVSGKAIRLENLRYWSVAHQEAYSSPEAALEAEMRHRQAGGKPVDERLNSSGQRPDAGQKGLVKRG